MAGPNGYRRIFAANLADEAESDLVPRAHPDLDTGPAGPAGRPVSVARDLRPWLIAGLLALLAFEWWVFHRRFHID